MLLGNEVHADGDLVSRVVSGDLDAFETIVRTHDDQLRGLAYKLLGGDRSRMDDVLQETYIKAYKALGTFRNDANLGSWLYRITYNTCMDELRRQGRGATPVDTSESLWDRADAATGPETTVATADATTKALAVLPEDQRVVVVLVDGEGFDHQAVADLLGIAVGTVASRLSRARATMRAHLGSVEL